jgi:hypothetical protein
VGVPQTPSLRLGFFTKEKRGVTRITPRIML